MSLLASATSITRYQVLEKLENPVTEKILSGLQQNRIPDIDEVDAALSSGWTSFQEPFSPDFEGASFVYGSYFLFSLRIDKKTIPFKLIQKYMAIEIAKKRQATGRDFVSKNEKQMIKEHVVNLLNLRIPATPNIYNVLWNYESSLVWLFTHLKGPNEVLETLFKTSFGLTLKRIFPFSFAESTASMSAFDRNQLLSLSPTDFQR